MDKREKVIKGLKYLHDVLHWSLTECEQDTMIRRNITAEAIALLKAQEPRVMTLEEVKAMKRYTICAVEQRSKVLHTTFNAEYRGHLTIGGRDCIDFGLYADVSPFRRSESGYGKTWRCWTSRPSDEVRRATPWTQTNGL